MALRRDLIDRFQGLTPDGQPIPIGDGMATQRAGRAREERNYHEIAAQEQASHDPYAGFNSLRASIMGQTGPLAGFFGALQNRADLVDAAGGNFNIDLVGRRGTSGIGQLRAQTGTDIPVDLDSLRGLRRAASKGTGY